MGQLEVDHVGKLLDVQTSGRDVRRDQNAHTTVLEVGERARAGALRLVAVDRRGLEAVAVQLLGEPVRAVLGPGEDQDLTPVVRADHVGEKLALPASLDGVDDLLDQFGRDALARDLDLDRPLQKIVCETLDLLRDGGGEEQRLALRGHHCQHTTDVVDEAHVEHPIGFVEDEHLDLVELDRALLHVVEQTPGGSDDDLHAAAQGRELGPNADATVDQGRANGQVAAVGPNALVDLRGELTRRHEDQRADGRSTALVPRFRHQPLQERQGEAGGLAGTGLRAGENVLTIENERDRLQLNGRRLLVILIVDCAQKFGLKAEI